MGHIENVHRAHLHAFFTSITPVRVYMYQIDFKCLIFLTHKSEPGPLQQGLSPMPVFLKKRNSLAACKFLAANRFFRSESPGLVISGWKPNAINLRHIAV